MAQVLVLVELGSDGVRKATRELLTVARRLGEPVAVLCGPADDVTIADLAEYGAGSVYAVQGDAGEGELVAPKVAALEAAVRRAAPVAVLVSSSAEGTEVAARLAVRLDSGILTGAVEVVAGDGGPLVTQSTFAGSWTTQSQVVRGTPVISVRPNAVTAEPAPVDPTVHTIEVAPDAAPAGHVTSRTVKARTGRPDLADAPVVVAGGRGMGSAEAFVVLEQLADLLGGAVGVSRAATDLDWYGRDFQIGQTGRTVAPQLYLAGGISGAIQHRAGMQGSRTVVAVNKDPKAPIFDIADFGVVGDVHTVLPALIEEIRARKT